MIYKLFELNVKSCVTIEETDALSDDTRVDVEVKYGEIDLTKYFDEVGDGFFIKTHGRENIFLSCPVGLFHIHDGKEITIQAIEGKTEREIRVFLLGSAMGAIQIQRGYIPVHGGAIVHDGKTIVLTGSPGAGKSTMTSTLVSLGYDYLTDDVASVIFEDGMPLVLPAYPQRKLVRDAAEMLGYNPENLPVVDAGRDKFAVRETHNFVKKPTEFHTLLKLVPNYDTDEVEVTEVDGLNKIKLLTQNLYRYTMHIVGTAFPPQDFKKVAEISKHTKMYIVAVPRNAERLKDFAKQIMDKIDL